jgi:hypothetical protein
MMEYRVKEIKIIQDNGNTTTAFRPQYRRVVWGIGLGWKQYWGFDGSGSLTGTTTCLHQAWNYINESKDTDPTYHYEKVNGN